MCMIKMMLGSTYISQRNNNFNTLENIIWNSEVHQMRVTLLIISHPTFKTKITQNLCLFHQIEEITLLHFEKCASTAAGLMNETRNEKKKNLLEMLLAWFPSTSHQQHFMKYWNTCLTLGISPSLLQVIEKGHISVTR